MRNPGPVKVGDVLTGEVFRITRFGAFVRLPNRQKGLIHISQIAEEYVNDINEHIKLGDKVEARVVSVNNGKIDLTLKKGRERPANSSPQGKGFRTSSLEEKLDRFLSGKK